MWYTMRWQKHNSRSVASIAYYDNNCSRIGERDSRIDTRRRRDRNRKTKEMLKMHHLAASIFFFFNFMHIFQNANLLCKTNKLNYDEWIVRTQ